MKEYFIWLCERLSKRWGFSEDVIAGTLMSGKAKIPEDLSIQNYIKKLKEEQK